MKIMPTVISIGAAAGMALGGGLCGWKDYGGGTVLYNEHCSPEQRTEITKRSMYLFWDKKYGKHEYEKLPPLPFENRGVLDYETMEIVK